MKRATCGGAYHWREYDLDRLLPDPKDGRDVLLVGCGDAGERSYLHSRGFQTIAFDIRSTGAVDFRADAHSVPIPDESCHMVISMQVLEHLHSPWQAVREMHRVLRPGGWCLGSVAFLKPFHASYFHMSHRGVTELLRQAGLQVDTLFGAQSVTYSLHGSMIPIAGRRLRRTVLGFVDRLILGGRAIAWSSTRRLDPNEPVDRFGSAIPMSFRQFDTLRFAPAVVFRAQKLE